MQTFNSVSDRIHAPLAGLKASSTGTSGRMVVLGKTPLLGALFGLLAIELNEENSTDGCRLWALYEHKAPAFPWRPAAVQQLPYARLCTDAPPNLTGPNSLGDLVFWIDPKDALTQAAGLAPQWLTPIPLTPRNGMVPARLNIELVDNLTLQALGLAAVAQ